MISASHDKSDSSSSPQGIEPRASRVSERTGDSEVLVSGRVRDLSIGSEIRFADRGAQPLKGLEGEWQMYAVAGT